MSAPTWRRAAMPPAFPNRPGAPPTAPDWRSLGPALRLRLPGDQDLAAGRDPTRGEAVAADGKEPVEAGLQNRAQALFEVLSQRPEGPLIAPKTFDRTGDGCLAGGSRYDGSSGMERQDADIGQDAQFPKHVHQLHMPGNHLLGFPVHELEEARCQEGGGGLLTVMRIRRRPARCSFSTNSTISRVK